MWKIIKIGFLIVVVWLLTSLVSFRWRDLSDSPQDGNSTLTIMTYNTRRMGNFEKAGNNAVVRYLRQVQADIVCLQEVEVYKNPKYLTLDELRGVMSEYAYTYYDFKVYNKRRQYGNVVFSKYPLINKHTIQYASKGNITSCCDVVVETDTLRLMVNHLESNRLAEVENKDTLLSKIESATKIRWKQAWNVKKAMWHSPYPLVVVGDFNSLPIGVTYQLIRLGMQDCFLQTNRWKTGNTYYRDGIGVRIDYILCSRSLQPYQCWVEKVQASDHYPVIASIEWAPDSGNR